MKKFILILFAAVFGVIEAQAQYGYNRNYTAFSYSVGIPVGDLADYSSKVSGRGFNFEFHGMATENLTVGVTSGVNVFYEEVGRNTYTDGTLSINGKHYRHTHSFPVMIITDYIVMPEEDFSPYLGLGIGTVYNERQTDFGIYNITKGDWQFNIKPEAGILFRIGDGVGFKMAAKYYQSFNSKDLDGQSFVTFDIGFVYLSRAY